MRMRGRGVGILLMRCLLAIAFFLSCIYISFRLWQDSERRMIMVKLLDKFSKTAEKFEKFEEKLPQMQGCKDAEEKLAELEVELARARNQGFLSAFRAPHQKLLAVIGISTGFGNKQARNAVRQNWMMTGTNLKKLEQERGILIRFIIGRSQSQGDYSDRLIDNENRETNDFMILNEHLEVPEGLAEKAKHFFSRAMETWDADFYIKVDDNTQVNLEKVEKLLRGYSNTSRIYVGCMKSGSVITQENQPWYEKEWWKFGDAKSYFRHAEAQFYGLSRALAHHIYVNRDFLHTYTHEDISVGSWMLGLDVKHIDERQFCCRGSEKDALCSS